MNKSMTYKGYTAKIEYSEEDECLIGRISDICHIITFHGDSVKEIRQAFEEAVNLYLDSCAKRNEEPEKPFTGHSVVRVSLALHSVIALAAKHEHKSINTWKIHGFRSRWRRLDKNKNCTGLLVQSTTVSTNPNWLQSPPATGGASNWTIV